MKRPVVKIDPQTGELVHRYESIKDAAYWCDIHPSAISHSLKGKCKAAGFEWQYEDHYSTT